MADDSILNQLGHFDSTTAEKRPRFGSGNQIRGLNVFHICLLQPAGLPEVT
jgi:hypothetical protein